MAGPLARRWRSAWCAAALAACGGRGRSTLDGVYTIAQATHGSDIYAGMCVSCHAGLGNHVGPVFRSRWGGNSLLDLYRFMSTNMPQDDPGSLAPDDYVAVLAYLLQMNGMPAGKTALAADTTLLATIRYDTLSTRH